MFGNLITNSQLNELRNSSKVNIDGFNPDRLRTTHYTLRPGRILTLQADGWRHAHSFRETKDTYFLEPNEYVVVEAFELVKIRCQGIVGRFITPSNLIEAGLSLNAGQIDNMYGSEGEALRFGLKNLLQAKVAIKPDMRLAHLEFFDIRGLTVDSVILTSEDKQIRSDRKFYRAADDGIDYGDGSS